MPRKVLNDQRLSDIAVAIRGKTGSEDSIKVGEMADIIEQDIDTKYEKYSGTINYSSTLLTRVTEDDLQGLTSLGDQGFRCCKSLESCDLPDTVTYIGKGSLKQTALKNMIHMGKPTVIEQCAFENNSKLQNVVIPETVTRIGQVAFRNCTSLTEVDCRATTPPELGGNVFYNCPKLKYIFVPADSVEAYKTDQNWMQYADIIYGSKFKFTVSKDITMFTVDDWYGIKNNRKVYLRSSSTLSCAEISNLNTNIMSMQYTGDAALTEIIIPDNITSIGDNNTGDSFSYCPNLKTVVIGTGVHTMYDNSFYRANTDVPMTVICKAATPPSIGNNCFPTASSGIVSAIYVPRDSVAAYKAANRWSDYAAVIKPITYKQYYNTVGKTPVDYMHDTLMQTFINRELTTVTNDMLDGITIIPNRAFALQDKLTYICIPASVTRLEGNIFSYDSALTTIECRATTPPTALAATFDSIPNLKYIYVPAESVDAYKAASGWSAYADIIYGSKIKQLTSKTVTALTADDFAGVTSISYGLSYYNKDLTSIEFSNTITDISYASFAGCSSLQELILPDNIVNIGPSINEETGEEANPGRSFSDCTSLQLIIAGTGLKQIYSECFYNCTALTTFVCKAAPTTAADVPIIDSNIFNGCSKLAHIYVPSESVELYKADSAWSVYADKIEAMPDEYAKINTAGRTGEVWDTRGNQYLNRTLTYTNANDINSEEAQIKFSAFRSQIKLIQATIPDTITSIASQAYYRCTSLENIMLSNNITTISNSVFFNCKSLTNITLPATLTLIDSTCFSYCTALTTVECRATTPPTLGTDVFSNCSALKYIYVPADSVDAYKNAEGWSAYADIIYGTKLPQLIDRTITSITADDLVGITSIRNGALTDAKTLTSVEIPNTVTAIGENAFSNVGITEIIIPNSVTSLGDWPANYGYTFRACSKLTTVIVGTGITSFGTNTFLNDTALTTVICKAAPTSVSEVPALTGTSFSGCTALAHIYVPSASVSYYKQADNWSTYASIIEAIPDEYNKIDTVGRAGTAWDAKTTGYFARTLAEIEDSDWPTGLTAIGYACFEGFTNLQEVKIPEGVVNTGSDSFYRASNLKSVVLPSTVQNIPYAGFYETSITNIILPATTKTIGNYALRNTTLTTIECRAATPPTLSTYSLPDVSNLKYIYVPAESVDLYKNASGWSDYADIIYGTKLGALIARKTLYSLTADDFAGVTALRNGCLRWSDLTSVELSNTITSIGGNAFSNDIYLKQIILPDSVVDLGAWPGNDGATFYACTALKEVIVGTGIQTFNTNTFQNCTALTTFVCKAAPTSVSEVPALTGTSFSGCTALAHIYVPESSVDYYKAADNWSTYASIIEAMPDEYAKIDTVGRAGTAWDSKTTGYFNRTLTQIEDSDWLPGAGSTYTSLGFACFQGFTGLTELKIPEGIVGTGWEICYRAYNISSVTFPSTLKQIANSAFSMSGETSTSLTSITLPVSLTEIQSYAFLYNKGLTTITCNATTPPTLGTSVFNDCPLAHIYVPSASVDTYKAASGWSTYADIIEAITEEV